MTLAKGLSMLFFFTHTLAYAHSRMSILAKYTSFDSYADVRRMCFAPNCNTSPGLAGPVGSSYEDYSVTKDTEEKNHRSLVSTAERLAVSITASYRLGIRTVSKLIPEVCEAICLCSFSSATCESIPPRQRFHLADKLITAREFNPHARPARTILMTKSASRALYAVPRVRVQSIIWP